MPPVLLPLVSGMTTSFQTALILTNWVSVFLCHYDNDDADCLQSQFMTLPKSRSFFTERTLLACRLFPCTWDMARLLIFPLILWSRFSLQCRLILRGPQDLLYNPPLLLLSTMSCPWTFTMSFIMVLSLMKISNSCFASCKLLFVARPVYTQFCILFCKCDVLVLSSADAGNVWPHWCTECWIVERNSWVSSKSITCMSFTLFCYLLSYSWSLSTGLCSLVGFPDL